MENNKLICPFCQQELDTGNYYVHCHNPHCDITEEMDGTEEIWEALIDSIKEHDLCHDALVERTKELNDTKKKLDIAVDGITYMRNNCLNYAADYMDYADKILEQINQKDK